MFDNEEGLLGESSGSLFDCLDYDTGVDDLLSDGRRASQYLSPMPSHLMQTFAVSPAACRLQTLGMSCHRFWRRCYQKVPLASAFRSMQALL